MAFEENTLLFGSDPTAAHRRDRARRHGDGQSLPARKGWLDHRPTSSRSTLSSGAIPTSPISTSSAEKLAGDLRYGWRISVNSWKELIALRNGLKSAGRSFFALSDPVQHYLTSHRAHAFQRSAVRRIDAGSSSKFFPSDPVAGVDDARNRRGQRPRHSDHIMSIALSDNSGWEELIVVDPTKVEESERAALKRLTAIIKERDPDVIEGHNLFRFDLPYLVARARKAKVKLDWGRSGGFLRSRPSRLQIAEKTIDYPKFTVDGRHFVDTFLLAHFYDVGMRSLSRLRADRCRPALWTRATKRKSRRLSGKELQRAYLDDVRSFPAARSLRRARNARGRRSPEPELFHPGADFPLQLPGRDRARQRHPH